MVKCLKIKEASMKMSDRMLFLLYIAGLIWFVSLSLAFLIRHLFF